MSATSRVGRLIASSTSWTALPRWDWIPLSLPAGWELPADAVWINAGKVRITDLGMTKQNLDGAQVSAGFQHMSREAVSKQMRRNAPADARAFTSLVHGLPHDLRSNGHICPPVVHRAWEQIGLRLHPAPVLTKCLQQLGAQ